MQSDPNFYPIFTLTLEATGKQPVPRSGSLRLRVRVDRPVKFHYLSPQHEPERDALPCVSASQAPWHATVK